MQHEYDGFFHLTPRGWIAGTQWSEGMPADGAVAGTRPADAVATWRLHVPAGDPADRTFSESWRNPDVASYQIAQLAERFDAPQPRTVAGAAPSAASNTSDTRAPAHDAQQAPGDDVSLLDGEPVFPSHGGPG